MLVDIVGFTLRQKFIHVLSFGNQLKDRTLLEHPVPYQPGRVKDAEEALRYAGSGWPERLQEITLMTLMYFDFCEGLTS